MSRSYHVTVKEIAKHSKREIDEMAKDPTSKLHELANKMYTKKRVLKKRKEDKQNLNPKE
jgi:predicted site-specific integrase-resolvase